MSEIEGTEGMVISTETIRPRYLSKQDAAKYIGGTAYKLRSLVEAGKISAPLRPNKRWVLYSLASLDAYLDSIEAEQAAAKA